MEKTSGITEILMSDMNTYDKSAYTKKDQIEMMMTACVLEITCSWQSFSH
jgi:hypothetical protein